MIVIAYLKTPTPSTLLQETKMASNFWKKIVAVTAGVVVSCIILEAKQVQAAIITYNFVFGLPTTSPIFPGETDSGFFSYDDSALAGVGFEAIPLDFEFTFLGRTFTEEDAEFPPMADFTNGSFTGAFARFFPTDYPLTAIEFTTGMGGFFSVADQQFNTADGPLCLFREGVSPSVCGAKPGSTQENPILPDVTEQGRFRFIEVPTEIWYDPPLVPGFNYEMTSDSLFTQILDFPTGIDSDNLFTVSVGETVLGQFSPGQSVDFVSLLGSGVSEFSVTGIEPLVDSADPLAFPLKLAFNTPTASFDMVAITPPTESVPEPMTTWGLLALGAFATSQLKRSQNPKRS